MGYIILATIIGSWLEQGRMRSLDLEADFTRKYSIKLLKNSRIILKEKLG